MKKKWIVVAESSRARIFSVESRTTPLKEVDDMVNVASRFKDEELVTDEPGRSFDSHGQGGRHAMEPRTEPKETEVMHFAHDLGERLENARRVGDYNDLVLISSPGFLGVLKQSLGNVTQKHISQTINKNLVQKSEAEIRDYLFH
ncbi:host attachment protein [Methylophaga sp.]|uniref:host attachment protein n=1 Tax=Methylophaga sp. TaxID=2024840 RepID=UPI003F6A460C